MPPYGIAESFQFPVNYIIAEALDNTLSSQTRESPRDGGKAMDTKVRQAPEAFTPVRYTGEPIP